MFRDKLCVGDELQAFTQRDHDLRILLRILDRNATPQEQPERADLAGEG